MRTLLAPLVLAALIAPAPAQEADDPRVAWLRDHAVSVRSLDPADEDFADLQPLKHILKDARIVQLGEQTHGDGAAFLAKVRLIKFLHQEMGFDVLAFESGLYDCRKAWQAFRRGDEPTQAARQGVFGIWTMSAQCQELWRYLARNARGDTPLELCGFDCQLTANGSRESLRSELRDWMQPFGRGGAQDGQWRTVERVIGQLLDRADLEPAEAGAAATLLRTWAKWGQRRRATDADRFWAQCCRSVAAQIHVLLEQQDGVDRGSAGINTRDAQMAANLIWLAETAYPKRKVIVWAATFHEVRNPATLEVLSGALDYTGCVPMGHLVDAHFGKACYTLGFECHSGQAGRPFGRARRWNVAAAPAGSFGDLCRRAGLENAIVDLRDHRPGSEWLREPMVARPLGNSPMRGVWSNVLDGFFFTRTMTPSTPIGETATPPPATDDLRTAIDEAWTGILRGEASGSRWVQKWNLRSAWERFTAGRELDDATLQAQIAVVTTWMESTKEHARSRWRGEDLLARIALARGSLERAIEHLAAAINSYPDVAMERPTAESFFQHLVNEHAGLAWDTKGFDLAIEVAARRLGTDRRFHYFHAGWWRERLEREGALGRWPGLITRVRAAYTERATNFPEHAAAANRYAAQLR